MPSSDDSIAREIQIAAVMQAIANSQCVAVVGLSNMGKSTLLRALKAPKYAEQLSRITGRAASFVLVDCNGMLELSGQGFYELILRSIREMAASYNHDLAAQLDEYYRRVVEPDSQFLVPLNFNNAMTALIEHDERDLILLFDEFDEAFDALDGRVFLNLRALKDKYPLNLTYVVATVRRLGARRSDEATSEFVELTAPHTVILTPFQWDEASQMARELARLSGIELSQHEIEFLWRQTGGHPRMLRAALGHLLELKLQGEPQSTEVLEQLAQALGRDTTIRYDCSRLWGQLGPEERETLLEVALGGQPAVRRTVESLAAWGILTESSERVPLIFSSIFADYVRRQATLRDRLPDGIWVDHDSGDVWVDGVPIPPLTELEFKLLALLNERKGKLTDKYQIVETVWGVAYINDVDDARIEKLVSRLRAKIEPDPGEPRYILTVRGRGYKQV